MTVLLQTELKNLGSLQYQEVICTDNNGNEKLCSNFSFILSVSYGGKYSLY